MHLLASLPAKRGFPLHSSRRRCATGVLAAGLGIVAAGRAGAQVPSPSPPPRQQDEPDQRARSSLSLGSGARAFGMGGAFLARADDATAASWNPAGLSYLKRPEFSVVGLGNTFRNTKSNSVGSFIERDSVTGYTPDFMAVTYPISLASRSGAAQVSFQRVLAYGGDRTIRREDRTFQIDSSGGFDVLAVGTGVQVSRPLRIGATFNRWFNGYHSVTDRLGLARGRIRLLSDFEISGWNLNAGLLYTPVESLNIGAVVKTAFTADVTLSRQRFDTSPEGEATTNFSRSKSLTLDFPGSAGLGLSWRPRSTLTLSLDYTRTSWSDGRINGYFTLPIQGQPTPGTADYFPTLPFPLLTSAVSPFQFDTDQTRVGVEYVVVRGRVAVPFRAGYFRDHQHFPDVDGNRPAFDGFTAGIGVVRGPVLLDGAFVLETGNYQDAEGNLVDATIRRFLVSLICRFGSR